MKKLALIIAVALMSMSCDNDEPRVIDFNALPKVSQEFVNTHFADKQISIVYLDKDFMDKDYEVIFTDGANIDFNKNGEWTDVEDRDYNGVPDAIIPAKILSFVKQKHPNNYIIEISKDRNEYDVELNNSLDITFDKSGNFRRYDD